MSQISNAKNPMLGSLSAFNYVENTIIPPFVPTDIAGCILWLDGNDVNGNGMNPTPGTSLATWVDKSGLSNNATQGTEADQPIFDTNVRNSLASVLFSSSSQAMFANNTAVGNQDLSVFIVSQYALVNDNVGTLLIGNQGISGGIYGFTVNPDSPPYFAAFSLFQNGANYAPADTDFHFWSSTYSTAVNFPNLWIDGNAQTSTSGGAAPNAVNDIDTIGASFTGYISEIIVYEAFLTDPQRLTVQAYLSTKWGF